MRGVIESASNERRGDRVEAVARWATRQEEPFESADLMAVFNLTRDNAQQVLHRLVARGFAVRACVGFYQSRSSK